MTEPPDPVPGPAEDADATVESPAAREREAARGRAPGAAPPPPVSGPAARRPDRRAWLVAIAADVVQWVLMPMFVPGIVSPADVILDLVVCALLVRWCGWHWAFLPSFVAELIPGVDLVPTWTAAMWLATLTRKREPRDA